MGSRHASRFFLGTFFFGFRSFFPPRDILLQQCAVPRAKEVFSSPVASFFLFLLRALSPHRVLSFSRWASPSSFPPAQTLSHRSSPRLRQFLPPDLRRPSFRERL